jgi:hypothetical protein
MDAITALGVAGNVVQFIDFGQKLLSTSFEIYKATNGASTRNKESETLLKDFIESIDTVSADLVQYGTRLGLTLQQTTSSNGLQEIVDDCRSLAADLLARFEKLKLERKPGRWKSVLRAVKCMWAESELQDWQARLVRYQSQLEWRILVSLR